LAYLTITFSMTLLLVKSDSKCDCGGTHAQYICDLSLEEVCYTNISNTKFFATVAIGYDLIDLSLLCTLLRCSQWLQCHSDGIL
jgi:hypothetical protein